MIVRHFSDPRPDEVTRPDINPYLEAHRAFGDEILPTDAALAHAGRWHEVFRREGSTPRAPLHLEIGSGNGFYLSGMARVHPECDWLGIELRYKRVVLVAKKLRTLGVTNARVARFDATHLDKLFGEGELAGVHINHPDPWAKDKHAKHRLIGRGLLEMLAPRMAAGAELRLKTDFPPHIDALLEAAEGLFDVRDVRADLATQGAPWPDEVVTNYQRKADERGVPVGAAWLTRRG